MLFFFTRFRSGETDTSIEILTSFDQLTLAPLPPVNDEERPECNGMLVENSISRPQSQPLPPQQSLSLPSLFTGTEKHIHKSAGNLLSNSPLPPHFASTSSSSTSSLTTTTTTPTAKSEIGQKREKKENFFCDFKSIPKFPKISSTKSDFHLPPSIFAAAAAAVASAATAANSADATSDCADGKPVSDGLVSGSTPVLKKRLLNGEKSCVMSALTVDTKSSDEYDFISSPER